MGVFVSELLLRNNTRLDLQDIYFIRMNGKMILQTATRKR